MGSGLGKEGGHRMKTREHLLARARLLREGKRARLAIRRRLAKARARDVEINWLGEGVALKGGNGAASRRHHPPDRTDVLDPL